MQYQKRIYLFCLLLLAALFCLPTNHANGTRISGDDEVTSAEPESDSSVIIPAPEEESYSGDDEINEPEVMAPPPGEMIETEGIDLPSDEISETEEDVSDEPSFTALDPEEMEEPAAAFPPIEENMTMEQDVSGASSDAVIKRVSPRTSAAATDKVTVNKETNGTVSIDIFNDMDITFFIKWIAEETGRNFVIDSNVKGKVTIISPRSVTIDEAYKIFESVLEVNGYTTVPSGSIIKIVPMSEGRSKDIETRTGKDSADPDDRLVTQLIPLKFANPNDIKTALAPFISKSSTMVAYTPTGTLIVTDILSNINRLLEIIEKLDVEGTSEIISVIPLNYAGAESIARQLTSVFKTTTTKSAKDTSTAIIIVSDTRTNSLITSASEADTLKIKELIQSLDKETPRGEGAFRVYYLQNANAEDLAKTLTSLPTTRTASAASSVAEGVKETPVVLSEGVQILADKATNSLIINASKDDYIVLEDIIQKLDITRKMVYIEALIMEVSMSKNYELGVQWYGGDTSTAGDKDILLFGSSNPEITRSPPIGFNADGTLSLPTGLSLGVLGDTITIGDLEFPSISAVVRAYATNTDVHIISNPQVMAVDNEEATINVSDNVPYLVSKQETMSGTDYSNYDFKDVGVILKITPQINQERFVKLKIEQEVSQLVEQEEIGLPTTLKREAKTTVVIKDGQTVVIGGLINETKNNTKYKVPILGDIPLIGLLFRSKTENIDKKNLYIFLTPHIVENPAEAEELYENKKGQMDSIEESMANINRWFSGQTRDERLADQGFSYLKLNEFDKAEEKFEKALEVNPGNAFALLNMGYIYEKKNDNEKAVEMYNRVIALDTDERTYSTLNPGQSGRKMKDIAADNIKKIEETSE